MDLEELVLELYNYDLEELYLLSWVIKASQAWTNEYYIQHLKAASDY